MDASTFEMDKKTWGKKYVQRNIGWVYIASYEEQESKIERFDTRIEEVAGQEKYREKVKRLGCFLGIKTEPL